MKLHSENQKKLGSDGAHLLFQPAGGRERQTSVSKRPAWSTEQLPGHRNPILQNQTQPTKQNKTWQQ